MWQPHGTSKFSKYLILLGQLTARNEHLSDTDIVIRNKDNLQPRLSMAKKKKKKIVTRFHDLLTLCTKSYLQKITNIWIMVHSDSTIGDEFDNPFGLDICSKCLSSKYAYPRSKARFPFFRTHFFHFLTAVNNSHYVE